MKIEEVAKIEKNNKVYYKLKIDGRNFTTFDSVEGFKQLEDGLVKAGYEAQVEYTETDGTFQGKPVKYKNVVKFSEIKEGVAEPKAIPVKDDKEVDWDAKERRKLRVDCLDRAIDLCAVNSDKSENLVTIEAVVKIAKKFETEYVYGDELESN